MSIINGRVLRDRRRGTCVGIALLIDECLKLLIRHLRFVDEDVVMHRTRSALDRSVRVEIEVVLERVGNSSLNESAWQWVLIPVTPSLLWEEADVVTLAAYYHHEWDVEAGIRGLDQVPHVLNLLLEDVLILAFGHAIAEIEDPLGKLTLAYSRHPGLQQWLEHRRDIVRRYHLNAVAVRLAGGGISQAQHVH